MLLAYIMDFEIMIGLCYGLLLLCHCAWNYFLESFGRGNRVLRFCQSIDYQVSEPRLISSLLTLDFDYLRLLKLFIFISRSCYYFDIKTSVDLCKCLLFIELYISRMYGAKCINEKLIILLEFDKWNYYAPLIYVIIGSFGLIGVL